jgi:tetratricopeptide (TPR) repeat protein
MREAINLDRAIAQICQVRDPDSFFFVAGAGISMPSVPVARQMIEEWKQMVGTGAAPVIKNPSPTTLDLYEAWFQTACFDNQSRQQYMRKKIENQLLPPASYKLAKIINYGKLSNIVVTTNFDTFLFKALGYLGCEPLLYDHPQTANDRFDMSRSDPQLVHVHGTYMFYDCANLRGEIITKTQKMLELLSFILRDHSPIVIGYSGWVDDVFMTALKQRLGSGKPMARNLYWFCYRQEDLNSQPTWLLEHESVIFVVPEDKAEISSTQANPEQRNSTSLSEVSEPALPAEKVFDRFICALKIPESELDIDPVNFFVSRLKSVLRGITDREIPKISEAVKNIREGHGKLEAIEKKLSLGDYSRALELSRALSTEIQAEQYEADLGIDLLELLSKIAGNLPYDSNDVLTAYENMETLAGWIETKGGFKVSVAPYIAQAWSSRGVVLLDQAKYADAIATFDQVLSKYGDTKDPGLTEAVATCRVNKGIALCRWKCPTTENEDSKEIFGLYDTVIAQYAAASDFASRETLASAKVNRAYLLYLIGKDDEALRAYEEIIKDFAGAVEPAIREHVVRAMINKAFSLGETKTREGLLASIDAYKQVTDHYPDPSGPRMCSKLAVAWNGLGFRLLLLAKLQIQSKESYQDTLDRALVAIQKAKKLDPRSWMIMGNEAYITYLMGKTDDARRMLDQTLKIGGEDARAGELRDTKIFTTEADNEFISWLNEGSSNPQPDLTATNQAAPANG